MKQAVDGEFFETAAHQIGDAGSVGAEQGGGLGLGEAHLFDQGVNFVWQFDLGEGFVGVGAAEVFEYVGAADADF